MREVTLMEVLDARDRRAEAQRRLLARSGLPLISFTMNIPGPVKDSPRIRRAFDVGLQLLDEALQAGGFECACRELSRAVTGCEALFAVRADAETLKGLCVQIEEGSPMGRLFDMDVIGPDGQKLQRDEERRCLVCGAQGRGCASRRLHSLDQLRAAVSELLELGLLAADADRIDALATKALLDEVDTTPKPGLVDQANNGSHRDMTPETFQKSADALRGLWGTCFRIGAETADLPERDAFARLRQAGLEAEERMFRATGGVNTHKGAIFTLGTVCGAIGRLWRSDMPCRDPEQIGETCARLCSEAVSEDFRRLEQGGAAHTAGERLYLQRGLRGIRGELADGLPAVRRTGLPALESGLAEGLDRKEAGVLALLQLIARGEDTNMIKRGGAALAEEMAERVRSLLESERHPTREQICQLDALFIRHDLSPGGCADLLAVSYFLCDWRRQSDI